MHPAESAAVVWEVRIVLQKYITNWGNHRKTYLDRGLYALWSSTDDH